MNNLLKILNAITDVSEYGYEEAFAMDAEGLGKGGAVLIKSPVSAGCPPETAEKLRRLASNLGGAGYLRYYCYYEFTDSSLLTADDNFIQRYMPLMLVFVKDEIYGKYSATLDRTLEEAALANIAKFSDEPLSLGGFVRLPKVSVIITNYNYEKYISDCIDSVIEQDYPFIKVFVADDKSTDGSPAVIESRKDAVTQIRLDVNRGQLGAMFAGFDMTDGEFVVFMDADDLMNCRCISAHLFIHLFKKPNVAFSCLRNTQISGGGRLLNSFHLDFANHGEKIVYIKPRVIHTPTWSWSTTSAMMFRSDVIKMIRTENTEPFRICADYYLVHFANLFGGSMLFDEAQVNYRRHGSNFFSKNLVVGGHKPTGHSEIHNHPSHRALQEAIVGLMMEQKDKFIPYFPSLGRFAETMAFVMPPADIIEKYETDEQLKKELKASAGYVSKLKKSQIRKKRTVIAFGNAIAWYRSVKLRIENYISVFCEK